MSAMLPKPEKTYEQMIAEARPREAEFREALARLQADPSSWFLEDQVTRLACSLTGYCDAIADLFGVGYDVVYEDVYEASLPKCDRLVGW